MGRLTSTADVKTLGAINLEDPQRDSTVQSGALRCQNKVFLSVSKYYGPITQVKRHQIKGVLFDPQT